MNLRGVRGYKRSWRGEREKGSNNANIIPTHEIIA